MSGLNVPGIGWQNRLEDVSQDLDRSQQGALGRQRRFHVSRDEQGDRALSSKDRDRLTGPLHLVQHRLIQLGCSDSPHIATLGNRLDHVNTPHLSLSASRDRLPRVPSHFRREVES